MQKTCLIYESKYGLTKDIVRKLALILGPARFCRTGEFREEYRDYDFFVIVSPVYSDSVDERIIRFVSENADWLAKKKVALLCTCILGQWGEKYLEPLQRILGHSVVWANAIGGTLKLEELDEADYESIKVFCKKTGFPFKDIDRFNPERMAECGLEIKVIKDIPQKPMANDELKAVIECFLAEHNTCTLCTGSGSRVRSTPIEYHYIDGCLYMLSEGGEKFANILLNSKVSVSVYDAFEGWNKLGGLQLAGEAELVRYKSEEYRQIVEKKGFDYEKLIALPVPLNLLRIRLQKAELIRAELAKTGCDVKQIYSFDTIEQNI